MTLVWKLLRSHISVLQLLGFFLANLLGMLIVLLALQCYCDVKPAFSQDEGIIKSDYIILSKQISPLGDTQTFSQQEIDDIAKQRFCKHVGAFTASQYRVACHMGMNGTTRFGTQMYFESVPDRFVDTDLSQWNYDVSEGVVPIILPRDYLAIYNFGFAQSQSLPKLNESVVSMVDLNITISGAGQEEHLKGHIVGFSSRINTILVPESFMQWSNGEFGVQRAEYRMQSENSSEGREQSAELGAPSRLIIEVGNPTDDAIATYVQNHGYDIDEDKLNAGKATYFLRIVSAIIMSVGILISVLSFYILMLSIYLLVQKNTTKLQNLLLIGYTPARVSLPYQTLTVGLNILVLLLAFLALYILRNYYMQMLWQLFPTLQESSPWPAYLQGIMLFLVVSCLNIVAIRRKIMNIWNRK